MSGQAWPQTGQGQAQPPCLRRARSLISGQEGLSSHHGPGRPPAWAQSHHIEPLRVPVHGVPRRQGHTVPHSGLAQSGKLGARPPRGFSCPLFALPAWRSCWPGQGPEEWPPFAKPLPLSGRWCRPTGSGSPHPHVVTASLRWQPELCLGKNHDSVAGSQGSAGRFISCRVPGGMYTGRGRSRWGAGCVAHLPGVWEVDFWA